MAIEWVVLLGALALLAGIGLGFVLGGRGKASKDEYEALQGQLSSREQELTDYRAEVLNQFADTAAKFRDLDESYHALHRQLANSAVTLFGDSATPLLAHDDTLTLTEAEREVAAENELAGIAEGDVEGDALYQDDNVEPLENAEPVQPAAPLNKTGQNQDGEHDDAEPGAEQVDDIVISEQAAEEALKQDPLDAVVTEDDLKKAAFDSTEKTDVPTLTDSMSDGQAEKKEVNG